jgi:hypothetical protein
MQKFSTGVWARFRATAWSTFWATLWAASCVLGLGCAVEEGEPTYSVTGTVKLKGQPVEGVAVSFVPDTPDGAGPGGGGQSAVGVTDAAGNYSLTTRKQNDGALVGRYKVGFAKYEAPPPAAENPTPAADKASYDVSDEYPAGYNPDAVPEAPPSKNLLPEKYADPTQSGFTAEVKAQANTFDFDLPE